MTARLRRAAAGLAAGLAISGALLVTAILLASERKSPQDISDPIGVSLVQLAPPAPPTEQEQQAPEEPETPPPDDFQPDLVQTDLGAAGLGDIGIAIDLGDIARRGAQEFVFDAGDLDQPPQAVVKIAPVYPFRARETGVEGHVKFRILVRADGSVGEIVILEGRPKGVFDDAVRKAVAKWKFNPGKIGGNAVSAWVVTSISFDIDS